MAVRNPADIRNLVLAGHAGSGKTTLTEKLLFDTKTTTRCGTVEEGNTVSDWTDTEKHHKHSLTAGLVHFNHEGKHVNIIDTPGMADFLGHAIACFPAAETVAVVVDAAKGIETGTRRLVTVARDRKLPVLLIINKIDAHDVDLEALVAQIQESFGSECLPINLPTADLSGTVNVFEDDHGASTLFSSIEEAHTKILDQVVEVDETLMEAYLGGADNLDKHKVHAAFEKALREAHLVPICFCSAKSGAGVDGLLHTIAAYCPSPVEGNPRSFVKTDDEGNQTEVLPSPDPGGHLLAHVFKVSADPFVGKLGIFRVHQGTMKAKTEVHVGTTKKGVRLGHLLRLQGKDQQDVDAVGPGDIGAVAKVDELHFDSVIHDSTDDVKLKPLPLPKPMFGLAVELKNHADETKFSAAIAKLVEEDPCFRLDRIAATKQTVMQGCGELHLRVMLERLKEQYKIDVDTSPPKVAYKETITANADGHHRHKKQTGGAGQFGEVYLSVEPLPQDHPDGFEFHNETFGGSIPRQFMPAIEKGVRQVLSDGAIAGYPMTGVCVRVTDGKYHAVDSKEVAFITAGKRAFIDAIKKARPVLLEPFVLMEITVPSGYMGDIAGDLSTKRGRVLDTQMVGSDMCLIKAQAPLSEVQNYTNELKSITAGAGAYSMDYSHDENTPPHIQQDVIAAFKPHDEDD